MWYLPIQNSRGAVLHLLCYILCTSTGLIYALRYMWDIILCFISVNCILWHNNNIIVFLLNYTFIKFVWVACFCYTVFTVFTPVHCAFRRVVCALSSTQVSIINVYFSTIVFRWVKFFLRRSPPTES